MDMLHQYRVITPRTALESLGRAARTPERALLALNALICSHIYLIYLLVMVCAPIPLICLYSSWMV